jgi:hypothetical protein
MKKMSFYLFVIFITFFITIDSHGQSELNDSIKTDLKLTEDVVKKLDSKDIVEVIKYQQKLQNEKEMAFKVAVDPSKLIGKFIPVMPIIGFTFILLALSIPLFFNYKKAKGRQLIINNLIEKGQEIPRELILPAKRNVRTDLHKGILLISLGLSVCIVLFVLKLPNNYWTFGLIPLFIGIGYLISFKLDDANKDKSKSA